MQRINDFKKIYVQYSKAVRYIIANETKLKNDPEKRKRILHNFKIKFEEPLDKAWKALSKSEKKKFQSLYVFRKASQDELVQKIVKEFEGKIVKG